MRSKFVRTVGDRILLVDGCKMPGDALCTEVNVIVTDGTDKR